MVKSFTDYWLVRLLIDKKTLSSYSLIKVSKCLVAAMCCVLAQSITQKFVKKVFNQKLSNQNVDECSKVHTVDLSEVWSRFRRLFCKVFQKFEASALLENLLFRRKQFLYWFLKFDSLIHFNS